MSAAEKVAAVTAIHEEAVRVHSLALANVDRAKREVEACEAAAGAASAAYGEAEEPSSKQANAAITADSALSLARKRIEAAQRKLTSAEEGKGVAERALSQAKREARIEELGQAAAPGTLHTGVEALWARWAAGRDFDALKGIVAEYRKSLAASAGLRELGVNSHALTPWHAVLPFLESSVAGGQAFPGQPGYEHFYETFDAVALLVLVERLVPRSDGHVLGLERFAEALRAGHRTVYEVENALSRMARDREAATAGPRAVPKLSPPSMQGRVVVNPGRST